MHQIGVEAPLFETVTHSFTHRHFSCHFNSVRLPPRQATEKSGRVAGHSTFTEKWIGRAWADGGAFPQSENGRYAVARRAVPVADPHRRCFSCSRMPANAPSTACLERREMMVYQMRAGALI